MERVRGPITDEILDHFSVGAPWDDLADALIRRYREHASRLVMYLAAEDVTRHSEHLPRRGEVARAVRAA